MIIKRFTSVFLGMNSVFISEDEKEGILVDPGVFPPELEKINTFLNRNGLSVRAVLYTHTHGDHISGWHAFQEMETYGHESVREKSEIERNNDLAFIQDLYSRSNFDFSDLRFPEFSYWAEEGETVTIGNTEVMWFHVPGHSKDSNVIILPQLNFMLSGDMLIHTSMPFILNSVQAYEQSLRKIELLVERFKIEQLAPGHATFAHSRDDIVKRIRAEQAYIENLQKTYRDLSKMGLETAELENRFLERGMKNNKIPYQHKNNVRKFLEELREMKKGEQNDLTNSN